MTESNDLSSPGEGRRLLGSQLASEAAANLLWRGAKGIAGDAWNLIKAPGQILEGSLVPSMEPGPNQLSIPEYALGLAGMGLGAGNVLGGAGAGAARQFGAWHGTRAPQFDRFSNEMMSSGAGAQTEGWGHYVSAAKEESDWYHDPGVNLTFNNEPWESGYGAADLDKFDPMNWAHDLLTVHNGDFKKAAGEASRAAETAHRNGDVRLAQNYDDVANFIDDNRDRIGVTPTGGLLRVHIKPEEEEFMAWHKPFSQQEPEVQQGILKSGLLPPEVKVGGAGGPEVDLTGEEIYNRMVDHAVKNESVLGRPVNYSDTDVYRADMDAVKKHVSQTLDANGVVGNKYPTAEMRGKTPSPMLKYTGDVQTAPFPGRAANYLEDYPAYTRNVDDEVKLITNQVREDAADRASDLRSFITKYKPEELALPGTKDIMSRIQDEVDELHHTANWIEGEHKAGRFKIKDDIKHNFVVFNPDNIEIRTWNGTPLNPVDHDPFGGGTP